MIPRFPYTLGLFLLSLSLCGGCQEAPSPVAVSPSVASSILPTEIAPQSHRELDLFFQEKKYGWESLENGVPPLIVTRFPEDMATISKVQQRKEIFFLSLLPMTLLANEEILKERKELLTILDRFDRQSPPNPQQMVFLSALGQKYKVKGDPLTQKGSRQKLLKRVDIVPPSMVLAQAASESAYGTSRFAQEGNNIFGEWTFTPGTGIVPEGRPEGESYEIRRFSSLYDSLNSYLRNINTHWAYQELRDLRAGQRAQKETVTGSALAAGLRLYSTRRDAYVEDIRRIIDGNRLSHLAKISLRSTNASAEPTTD
ncbi:MAG: Bax protein [Desulfuromonas sp.]|nr:MAG: Bax protein [Desulfuromonas sp.]